MFSAAERAVLPVAVIVMCAVSAGCYRAVSAGDWKTAILNLPLNGSDPELTTELKESVALLPDASSDPAELAKAYRVALGSADTTHIADAAHRWMIVAAGPLLDSPDQAVVRKAELDGSVLRVEAVYTSTRMRGGQLRRNLAWRPLLTIPIGTEYPNGDYQVQVSWQPVESLASGKALGNPRFTGPLFVKLVR